MIYTIALSAIASALGIYCYFLFKNLNCFKKHGIPCKLSIPFLGDTGLAMLRFKSQAQVVKEVYNIHSAAKYVGMFDITTPIIVIRDLELIRSITVKHFDVFPDHRSFANETDDSLFGGILFLLHGKKWQQTRYLLSPAFTSNKMKSMFKLMSDYNIEFVNYLAQLPSEQKIMEMKDVFTKYTNDMIAIFAFGINVDSIRNPENKFYVYGKQVTAFSNTALIKIYIFRNLPWLARLINLKLVREEIADFFRNLVQTTIKSRDENGITHPDVLQLMMENRGKEGKTELSIDDMVAQAYSFFFGGYESSSTLLCFSAHEIAINQDVQDKLQEEIDQVLEKTNGQGSYEAINSMEYLDAVLSEALRMYPIAIAMERVCVKDFVLPPTLPGIKPFSIKKGQALWIPLYGLQRDPIYFKQPEKFDPERFCGERKKDSLNCGAYLPFGLGPRMCIGKRFALLEAKILFFHLLARCELKVCEKTPLPLKIAKDSFTLKAEGGFWLKILPRKNIHHSLVANLVNKTH